MAMLFFSLCVLLPDYAVWLTARHTALRSRFSVNFSVNMYMNKEMHDWSEWTG